MRTGQVGGSHRAIPHRAPATGLHPSRKVSEPGTSSCCRARKQKLLRLQASTTLPGCCSCARPMGLATVSAASAGHLSYLSQASVQCSCFQSAAPNAVPSALVCHATCEVTWLMLPATLGVEPGAEGIQWTRPDRDGRLHAHERRSAYRTGGALYQVPGGAPVFGGALYQVQRRPVPGTGRPVPNTDVCPRSETRYRARPGAPERVRRRRGCLCMGAGTHRSGSGYRVLEGRAVLRWRLYQVPEAPCTKPPSLPPSRRDSVRAWYRARPGSPGCVVKCWTGSHRNGRDRAGDGPAGESDPPNWPNRGRFGAGGRGRPEGPDLPTV